MPTKKRQDRKRKMAEDAAATRQHHDKIFANTPAHIREFPFDNLSDYVNEGQPPSATANLGHGLVTGDDFGNTFANREVIAKRADTANAHRHLTGKRSAEELKMRYSSLWNMRGTAKKIAHEESLRQRDVSVRTIQRYQKYYP